MANLIVRNVDDAIVKALKTRARKRGTSAEAEHRAVLIAALLKPRRKSFAEVLAALEQISNTDGAGDPQSSSGRTTEQSRPKTPRVRA